MLVCVLVFSVRAGKLQQMRVMIITLLLVRCSRKLILRPTCVVRCSYASVKMYKCQGCFTRVVLQARGMGLYWGLLLVD
jgi:hypothetical protein